MNGVNMYYLVYHLCLIEEDFLIFYSVTYLLGYWTCFCKFTGSHMDKQKTCVLISRRNNTYK